MKKLILIIILFSSVQLYAQDLSAIKLFVYQSGIYQNNPNLTRSQQDRLFRNTTQLINETGIAELGYSTFLVAPKFEVVNVGSSQTGTLNVYLAECELNITVDRMTFNYQGGATFSSFTKTINGSGMSKEEAVNNAINNISPTDKQIVNFLTETKKKIDTYFQMHCEDVMKQAQQALVLKKYSLAISLYLSVPTNASCYKQAIAASEKVYKTYSDDQCDNNLIRIKAFIAMANSATQGNKNYADSALYIMSNLSPAAEKCYADAAQLITKLEGKLNQQQKQEWEFRKKRTANDADVQKEMYKAMGRISTSYQPGASDKTIIIH
jgi:hypothetical protein